MQIERAKAESSGANTQEALPDLSRPSPSSASFNVTPSGATLSNTFDGKRLVVSPEYSQQTGLSLGGAFALPLGENAAGGIVATVGDRKNEVLFNAGFQLNQTQRLIATLGQLRQKLDFNFISGTEKAEVVQTSGALSYQRYLGEGWLNGIELNGYLADTPSRDLTDKTYAIDTAALYELWNDPRRIAGGRITGLQGKLALTPLTGSTLKLGAGGERLEYDYLTGKQSTTRATASAEWSQQLSANLNLKAGADTAAAQNRFTLGLEQAHSDGWKLGANLAGIRGRDGAPDDNQLNLTLSYTFGAKGTKPATGNAAIGRTAAMDNTAHTGHPAQAWGNLLDQVAKRPTFLPSQVVAKLDTTATPTRLIAVNKAALPAGSGIDTATGIITAPLGVAVTGIAGVTKNGPAFANTGQFALSGNSLAIDPNKIAQPAVGVTDTYVVTVNNLGGGTTLVTLLVSHGSVKIDSIVVTSGVPTAPTASALSITGTVQAGQQLTGHYTYTDVNGDAQGVSTFRWLRNGVAIAGATASTYTLVIADVGNAITFEVTPVSTVVPTTGAPVTSSATAAVTLPAGYVSQGGLTWMPNNVVNPPNGWDTWTNADTYCTNTTILGQTGWRLPTTAELSALYASGAIAGQGWALDFTWSSTPHGAGFHEFVFLDSGNVNWSIDANGFYVSCVR